MGLFKTKRRSYDENFGEILESNKIDVHMAQKIKNKTNATTKNKNKNKKFSLFRNKKNHANGPSKSTEGVQHRHRPAQRRDVGPIDMDSLNSNSEEEYGDIPRSIHTFNGANSSSNNSSKNSRRNLFKSEHDSEQRGDLEAVGSFMILESDVDSLESPCETMCRSLQSCVDRSEHVTTLDQQPQTDDEYYHEQQQPKDIHNPPSLIHLSQYIEALSPQKAPNPSSDSPSRALRSLFALSEHSSSHADRVAMIQPQQVLRTAATCEGLTVMKSSSSSVVVSLVPALLNFLKRCRLDSSEQYLTMLVLNNISIPHENKRCIALECGGAKTLGRLLCQDPVCHLLVIIIVNLTFCEPSLRRDLLTSTETSLKVVLQGTSGAEVDESNKKYRSSGGDVQLVDALAYALIRSTLTPEQMSELPTIPLASPDKVAHTPRKLLSLLKNSLNNHRYKPDVNAPPLLMEKVSYPETVRWCMCAFKNLTRPGKFMASSMSSSSRSSCLHDIKNEADGEAVAAYALLDAGILPFLLLIVRTVLVDEDEDDPAKCHNNDLIDRPLDLERIKDSRNCNNIPIWISNSAQDAALYTLMHISMVPEVRAILREECDCLKELSAIVNVGKLIERADVMTDLACNSKCGTRWDVAELAQLDLQCMKARIALSYLLGSERHYGVQTGGFINSRFAEYESYALIASHESDHLVELLANCLHDRPKEGPGGYSTASFTLKGVLYSIRCLMSNRSNRVMFACSNGTRLNALMLKALGHFALQSDQGNGDDKSNLTMDAEAAEHAVVSLYFMSNHGFHESVSFSSPEQFTFLPESFEDTSGRESADAKMILMKILIIFVNMDIISPAGRHAAVQILLRTKFLRFSGTITDLLHSGTKFYCRSDFVFEDKLLNVPAKDIERWMTGVQPTADLFQRAIVQCTPQGLDQRTFSCVLAAVEELSFGRSTTDLMGTIDEISIANNIASSADGMSRLSYGYVWRWDDDGGDINGQAHMIETPVVEKLMEKIQPFVKPMKNDGVFRSKPYSPPRKSIFGRLRGNGGGEDEPFSIFGFRCGPPMCGK